MEGSIPETNAGFSRVVLREITLVVTHSAVDSHGNANVNDILNLGRTLRPRPRVTYADLSPVRRRAPSPQLPTGSFTFEPIEPDTRPHSAAACTSSCRHENSPTFSFETPPKTPRSTRKSPSKRPIESPTSSSEIPFTIHLDSPADASVMIPLLASDSAVPAKRPRMLLLGDKASLGQQLASLSNEQLVEVVEKLVEKYPDMHQEVLELLPEPDLSHCQERLSELLHNIFRALPRTRLASTRSALSYRQVKVHLLEFKKYCILQGRHLISCQAWTSLVNYVLLTWQIVNYLPIWENPSHNNIRGQCLRSLVVFCSKGLRSCDQGKEWLADIRPRLVKAYRLNSMMQPCLDILNTLSEV